MKKVLVTGANGFIGKNLTEGLRRKEDVEMKTFVRADSINSLVAHLKEADIVFHLAGVNRPEKIEEFEVVNVGLTRTIVDIAEGLKRSIPLVFLSSIQATLDNPYGNSQKKAEDILIEYSRKNNAKVYIYRLSNVFGKWCRPNYNSVVATFCYNISHGLDINISDVNKEIGFVYIDDVVNEFLGILTQENADKDEYYYKIKRISRLTLGDIAKKIYQLRDIRKTLVVPDLSDEFMKCLYATYLSYLDKDDFSYALESKADQRGSLSELIKSEHFGQIFVSTSHKGVIRGNHYHNTKVEKFCVLKGEAVIRFRSIQPEVTPVEHPRVPSSGATGRAGRGPGSTGQGSQRSEGSEVIEYRVSGREFRVVDIPPGYTHSIENIGDDEMIVLFWANQIFDPEKPDTYYCEVEL